jgi:2',3'-cyclic-nucleotide 2'-phosphodiesterase/3'-nucleotidase
MRMLRVLLALPIVLALAPPAAAENARITILHTTDLHAALTDYDHLTQKRVNRGLVRIASMVRSARAEGNPVLLLDAGDAIHGGPIETVHHVVPSDRPDPMMAAMNLMGYDAMAVGNHEFDSGLEVLQAARKTASFPWLAANVVTASGAPAFDSSLVKDMGGVRVGIVGVTTPAVPHLIDAGKWRGLEFKQGTQSIRDQVAKLRSRDKCDVVVLLAHTGLEKDPASGQDLFGGTPGENIGHLLATEVEGVDVVVLGHTHTVVEGVEVGRALVTQAGHDGSHLGRVDLTLTRETGGRWLVTNRQARVLAVNEETPQEESMASLAKPYADATEEALSRTVAQAQADIASPQGRLADGAVWEFIHRVQLEASGAQVSLAALFDPEVVIRKGPVTWRDLLRVYPYDNTLGVVEITGTQLKNILERSARYLNAYTFAQDQPMESGDVPGYNFDSAEGVSYEIDLTRPVWNRVVNLEFRGAHLEPDRVLSVVVNSYRLAGGGGYTALRDGRQVKVIDRPVVRLLAEYAEKHKMLDGSFVRNWQILPDYAATPERPLIDVLVRQGKAPREEVLRLGAYKRAQRGDLAYWLARAFDLRSSRASGAFADVPSGLEPWVDGLLEGGVLGGRAAEDSILPFEPATVFLATELCENAARVNHYQLKEKSDSEFRNSLLTGVGFDPASPSAVFTRANLLGVVSNTRFPTLRVLSTTDFHGAILPSSDRRTARMQGGSAWLAAHIEKLRRENPYGTVLLDGGDCFQGTMISNLQFGQPVVEQMNRLGYAAMAIGNHEFDWTADTLERRVREMNFAALAANFVERESGRWPAWARGDTMLARRGIRIGVLGLAYRYTPSVTLASNVTAYRFEDDSAAAAVAAAGLRDRKAEVVLGVGHIPVNSNNQRKAQGGALVRLARGVRSVDAWFGGHSHIFVEDQIDGTPVLVAGSHGRAVAVCDLVMDPLKDAIVERRYRLQETWHDQVEPDSAWLGLVERWNARVAPLAAVPVGRNAASLDRSGEETTIGNLMTDAMLDAVRADIALQNSGGMRADLDAGEITRGEVYAIMPFDNTIVTLELTGAEVKKALDEALQRGRVTQVSGVRYIFDPDRPPMDRVVEVAGSDGRPLDPRKTYVVACNNFMSTGGDDYNTLATGKNMTDTGVLLRDAIENYVRKRSADGGALDLKPDGRVQRVERGAPPGGAR